jgi:hypothetical protein
MTANPDGSAKRAELWRSIARRLLPRGVLFVGLALILINLFHARPEAVDVLYEYGRAGHGLQATRIAYLQGGELIRSVQFDYRQRGASTRQRHEVQLPEGDYTLELTLAYAGQPPSGIRGTRTALPGGASEVTLRRPLLVHGGGELRVEVCGSSYGSSAGARVAP